MNKCFLFVFLFFASSISLLAQELNVKVSVKAPRIVNTDPRVFQTLEREITEFINNTKWTEDEYEDFEKIEGNLNITITEEQGQSSFIADFFIQTIRPVYNSNYKSQTLNLVDKSIGFEYRELQQIKNSFSIYSDQLSSLLTYYVFLMLGSDYDTFSPMGGDDQYKIAQNIVNAIPNGSGNAYSGWQSIEGNRRNKYWIIENMLNPRVRQLRQAIYEYYIQSLDIMHEDPDKARAIMLSALNTISQVNKSYPNTAVVQMFADSKRDEILEIFKGAAKGQQTKVYDIMVKIDPAQASRYNPLR